MTRAFKTILVAAILSLLVLVVRAGAEDLDLVPRWSFGPTAALSAIRQGPDGAYHNELLTGGAGVQVNMNLVDSMNYPWVGVSNPWLVAGASANDYLRISTGLTLTLVGNFTIGGAFDVFKSVEGEGSGLMTGTSSWQDNGTILFGLTVPIGANAGIWTMGR